MKRASDTTDWAKPFAIGMYGGGVIALMSICIKDEMSDRRMTVLLPRQTMLNSPLQRYTSSCIKEEPD
jgi:hypothetical protein